MKFAHLLEMNMVPEWRNQYIDYKRLDGALSKAVEAKHLRHDRANCIQDKGIDSYFRLIKSNQKFANYFAKECKAQLDKVNAFHREKLHEMKGKYNNLYDQLEQVLSSAISKELHLCPSNRLIKKLGQRSTSRQAKLVSHIGIFKSRDQTRSPGSSSPESISSRTHLSKSVANMGHRLVGGVANRLRHSLQSISNSTLSRKSPSNEAHTNSSTKEQSKIDSESDSKPMQVIIDPASHIEMRSSPETKSSNLDTQSESKKSLTANKQNGIMAKLEIPVSQAGNTHQSPQIISHNGLSPAATCLSSDNFLAHKHAQSRKNIIAFHRRKISNLKFAFQELYLNLVLFEQYTQLNYAAFEQILRKHDRMFASSLGRKFFQEHVQPADFQNDLQVIDQLIENVEHVYTLNFEDGNRGKAIEKLSVPADVYKPSAPMLDFRVGFELGCSAILFLVVLFVGLLSDTTYDWRTVFRLYRSPLILIIFLFQTGISLVIWNHYKINHVLIFELNPRNKLSFQHFLEFASSLAVIWSISVITFLYSERLSIAPALCPLVVVLLVVIYLFNPMSFGHHKARFWLLRIIGRIFSAPFKPVRFADFWIADQLVSIVPFFLDLEYLSCYYLSRDQILSVSHLGYVEANRCVTKNPHDLIIRTFVAALPAWFRAAQCLRRWHDENWLTLHIANAAKYSCMVATVVLSSIAQYIARDLPPDAVNIWRYIWLAFAIFTSSLTAYWDIIYDFGLFNTYDNKTESQAPANHQIMAPKNSVDHMHTGSFSSAEVSYKNLFESPAKGRKTWPFLRKQLVYPVWVYYFAIIENFILRFGWVFTISLTEFSDIEAGLVVSLLAPLEMFRRFVWNCIRLENEQLNNCGLFRAVRDIPIETVAPIDESQLDKVIMMMDSHDGPSMRSRLLKRRALRPDSVSFMMLHPTDESP